jgi:hypothetical protein
MCRLNFQYNQTWRGKHYAIKQGAPVIVERANEIVVDVCCSIRLAFS